MNRPHPQQTWADANQQALVGEIARIKRLLRGEAGVTTAESDGMTDAAPPASALAQLADERTVLGQLQQSPAAQGADRCQGTPVRIG